jgi:hypothetical protein
MHIDYFLIKFSNIFLIKGNHFVIVSAQTVADNVIEDINPDQESDALQMNGNFKNFECLF